MASRGRPEDPELFLPRPNDGGDSPTIEPLRIHRASPQPPRNASAQGQKQNYPPPKSTTTYSFPAPPSLPYPTEDDEGPFQYPKPETKQNRAPYPQDEAHRASPQQYSSTSPPPRTDSSQSYGKPNTNSRKTSYDQPSGPRLGQSPVDQRGPGLAQRRGAAPKPLPESPGPDLPDKDNFRQEEQRAPYMPPNQGQQYDGGLIAPQPTKAGLDRYSSTASTSTTRASRGSPAPPETPIVGPGETPGGIEARYAASGISGTATLNSLQAQNAASQQRLNQYYQPPQLPHPPMSPAFTPAPVQQQAQPRPWTPTELPGDVTPHGPSVSYQGANQLPQVPVQQQRPEHARMGSAGRVTKPPNALEQDFQRMQITADEPPPAYSSVTSDRPANAYPNEKAGAAGPSAGPSSAAASYPTPQTATMPSGKQNFAQPLASPALHPGHPAFANDPRPDPNATPTQQFASSQPFRPASPEQPPSPPPLPEGWMANLDQASKQYYYIHIATQSTQWEFPKGLAPLNSAAPLSPSASVYGARPLFSPMSPGMSQFGGNGMMSPGMSQFGANGPMSPGASQYGGNGLMSPTFPRPGYAESVMSMASVATTTGFSGPPVSTNANFKIEPYNKVYFGPYLKYINMDLERGIWLGSIMLVTDGPQPPTIHIHRFTDERPNPRQLEARAIFTHQRWVFYRYDVDLEMSEQPGGEKWTYAISSRSGCIRYHFLVAGRHDKSWRFIIHSGNDFQPLPSDPRDAEKEDKARQSLGGASFMWKDVMAKHRIEGGGFHVQLGLGDQICADPIWRQVALLDQWRNLPSAARKNAQWTASHEENVSHAFFHFYTKHFDQDEDIREAFAEIPAVCQIGDHEVFENFGSLPEEKKSQMHTNIGRIGIEMYLLFQHHTTLELLRNVSDDTDLFTITGAGWHFVKYLGPALAVVGPDVRSERTINKVLGDRTWQELLTKVSSLPPSIQHCLWMVGTPLLYPRQETMEAVIEYFQTGKKAVNKAFNVAEDVTSYLAGAIGGRKVVRSGFDFTKKKLGKDGLMSKVLDPFGEVEAGKEFLDMWTHPTKEQQRTYFIRKLQGIAQNKGLRMTFLSGGTNTCSSSLLHDPSQPSDHKTMYQLLTSSIVAMPHSDSHLRHLYDAASSLDSNSLYVSADEHKLTKGVSDTKEDMMEIFLDGRNDQPPGQKRLMGRRNYIIGTLFGEEDRGYSLMGGLMSPGAVTPGGWGGVGGGKLSLAVDFIVQAPPGPIEEGGIWYIVGHNSQGQPILVPRTHKFGPVVVSALEFGR